MSTPNKLLLTLLLCGHYIAAGQDSTKVKRVKILPVPAFGYTPETKSYIGAVTLFTFNTYSDTLTRTSIAKLKFTYTWNKQSILESEWNYFFKEEKWLLKGKLQVSEYPDLYYGIGINTPVTNELLFNSNRFNTELYFLKKIYTKLFAGVSMRYVDYSNISYNGTTQLYPELHSNAVAGLGVVLLKDSRNSVLSATKGVYAHMGVEYDVANENYFKAIVDLRKYNTITDRLVLANRLLNNFIFGRPPFYDYSIIGGDNYVRGYYYGRYRDNNLFLLQSEVRLSVIRRWGLAAFGGVSSAYDNLRLINGSDIKYNYGMGLRFMIDRKEKTNLRLDYGIGENGSHGFYVFFGESF
jgi:hypothetical protein